MAGPLPKSLKKKSKPKTASSKPRKKKATKKA